MNHVGADMMDASKQALKYQNIKRDFWKNVPHLIVKHLYDAYVMVNRLVKVEYVEQDVVEEKIKVMKRTPWVKGLTHEQNSPVLAIPPARHAPVPPQLGIEILMYAVLIQLHGADANSVKLSYDGL
jgi:hypothetical protein